MSPSMSMSPIRKPGTGVGVAPPTSATGVPVVAPPPSVTVGASFTGVIVNAIVTSGGLAATLPLPTSPPMREPVSSKETVSVTSPPAPPLVSWLTLAAPL